MYQPSHFAENRPAVLAEFIGRQPLGLLITQDRAGTLAADRIPFVLDPDPAGGLGILRAHVARANPLWRTARGDLDSLVVFEGPEAYVSPSFYPAKAEHGKVVPTWNYIVVQGRGKLSVIDDAGWLRTLVTRLTDRHEAPRAAPWAIDDAPPDFIATLLGAIVGIEIVLTGLVGKWKLGQNRSAADQAGTVRGLREPGATAGAQALADALAARGTQSATGR